MEKIIVTLWITFGLYLLIIEIDEEGNETEVYREGFTSYDEGNYPFDLTKKI